MKRKKYNVYPIITRSEIIKCIKKFDYNRVDECLWKLNVFGSVVLGWPVLDPLIYNTFACVLTHLLCKKIYDICNNDTSENYFDIKWLLNATSDFIECNKLITYTSIVDNYIDLYERTLIGTYSFEKRNDIIYIYNLKDANDTCYIDIMSELKEDKLLQHILRYCYDKIFGLIKKDKGFAESFLGYLMINKWGMADEVKNKGAKLLIDNMLKSINLAITYGLKIEENRKDIEEYFKEEGENDNSAALALGYGESDVNAIFKDIRCHIINDFVLDSDFNGIVAIKNDWFYRGCNIVFERNNISI